MTHHWIILLVIISMVSNVKNMALRANTRRSLWSWSWQVQTSKWLKLGPVDLTHSFNHDYVSWLVHSISSYDLVFMDDPSELVRMFKEFEANVVFSAEAFCWPDPSLAVSFHTIHVPQLFNFNFLVPSFTFFFSLFSFFRGLLIKYSVSLQNTNSKNVNSRFSLVSSFVIL